MYSEAKLAFIIYLWYPKTKGTTYVYDSFFRPYLAKHETEIDRNLLELRTRAGDIAVLYWQRAASYGQTRIYDILQYVAAQSTPRPRPSQPQQPSVRVGKTPATSNGQAASPVQPQTEEPPSPTSSTSSSQHQKEVAEEVGRAQEPKGRPAAVGVNTQKATAAPETTSEATPTEAESMQIEVAPSSSNDENTNTAPKETVMEEAIRVTRGRLRKARSAGKSPKNES
ncbi:hypothetical protein I3843_08G065400 [Carya illinoinensis]|nr:hypothetical protein I3843_08G065400 [Carya illinoinensis]